MSPKSKNKIRLDQLLIERELFESRTKAQAAIMSGVVFMNRQKSAKSGAMVDPSCLIEIKGKACPYVSRGGFKLEHALSEFNIDVKDRICLDIGVSTGGFTDCLLQNGAKLVYAVDVGYGQIAWKLRQDERVVVIERTNARYLTAAVLEKAREREDEGTRGREDERTRGRKSACRQGRDERMKGEESSHVLVSPDEVGMNDRPTSFVTMDVSFISITKILPAIYNVIEEGGEVVSLVKPQFEAGRGEVPRGGVVKDLKIHQKVLDRIKKEAEGLGFSVRGICESPILGADGNKEFFIWMAR